MDADVATHLLHRCILGALSHTTRLLCTHRTEYLERADTLVLASLAMVWLDRWAALA